MQATIAGTTVHYDISGQGPWLMLSHSLAAHSGMWKPQLEALERHFTVLRYDIRGHGGSAATPAPYTMAQLADDAHALLQHLGVSRTHWLGLSLGGMIGQTLAIRHPEALDRVVLADTTGRVPPEGAAMWAERARTALSDGLQPLVQPTLSRWFTEPFRQRHPDVMAEIGAMIAATPTQGYAGCCTAIAPLDTLEALRTMRSPALVLVGDQDLGTPPAAARAIAAHWPGAQLQIIEDAAHLPNIEQAAVFNEAVLRFLTAA